MVMIAVLDYRCLLSFNFLGLAMPFSIIFSTNYHLRGSLFFHMGSKWLHENLKNTKQETLCFVTIAMICSTLASL